MKPFNLSQHLTRSEVSVMDFGAKGDGVTDDTAAFHAAIITNSALFLPAGTYRVNLDIDRKIVMRGEGTTLTLLYPFDETKPIALYSYNSVVLPMHAHWTYHSLVEEISFYSVSEKTGIGWTFGQANPADNDGFDQYVANVTFRNCRFSGLYKGVQCPLGNIGVQFYDCSWTICKYGVYLLDNKFGGDVMHAGNKYFFGGEMSACDCAVYLHDRTDGFGAVEFFGTILEYNKIACYLDFVNTYVPISFNGVWFEGNGQYQGGTQVIDAWTGTARSDQTVTNKTLIIAGGVTDPLYNSSAMVVINDGTAHDIHVKHNSVQVQVNSCRVESNIGYAGGSFVVEQPIFSRIECRDPISSGGLADQSYTPFVTGRYKPPGTIQTPSFAYTRPMRVKQRSSKVTGFGPSKKLSVDFTTAATLAGAFAMTGAVVADGVLFPNCNEFSRANWLPNEFVSVTAPVVAVPLIAGWYVFTIDVKLVAGVEHLVGIWDLSANQFAACVNKVVGQWQTFASIAYSADSGGTLGLTFAGGGTGSTTTIRVGPYQMHRFNTFEEASNFLQGGAFVV